MRGYIPSLDGLRGLAVLVVVFAHSTMGMVQPLTRTGDILVHKAAGHVNVAMDVFFVLSGFLITGILADSKGQPNYYRNYFARRSLRVFPLYYAFILLLFIVLPALGIVIPDEQAMRERWTYFLYLQNIPFAVRGDIPEPTGYLWSMAVEEQYYLFWPLVVLAASNRTLQKICLATIPLMVIVRFALVAQGASFVLLYVTTLLRMDALLMGSFLALRVREPGGVEQLRRIAKPLFVVSSILEVAMIAYKPIVSLLLTGTLFGVAGADLAIDRYVQAARFTAHALWAGSALILIADADMRGRVWRSFAHPVMRMFGKYSYATYMFHVPLLLFAESRGISATRLPLVGGAQWPRAILLYLLLLGASLALAALSWRFFEEPMLRLKRLFPYAKAAPAPAVVPSAAQAIANGAVPDDMKTAREVYQSP